MCTSKTEPFKYKKEEAEGAVETVIASNSYVPEFVIVKEQVGAALSSAYSVQLLD